MKYMRRNASNKHVKVKSMVMKHTAESIRVVEYQQEREILYDNLFASRTFKYKIRPIVEEYRHRRAMRRSIHHPYGRRASPSTSPTDDSLTSKEFVWRGINEFGCRASFVVVVHFGIIVKTGFFLSYVVLQ